MAAGSHWGEREKGGRTISHGRDRVKQGQNRHDVTHSFFLPRYYRLFTARLGSGCTTCPGPDCNRKGEGARRGGSQGVDVQKKKAIVLFVRHHFQVHLLCISFAPDPEPS